jgi:hypothetical protein
VYSIALLSSPTGEELFTQTSTDCSRFVLYKRNEMRAPTARTQKKPRLHQNKERTDGLARDALRRIGRVTVQLREAQARGETVTTCKPEEMAQFLVASLKGAIFLSKLTRDPDVMERLDRYLALYEARS